jgi:hypothetical protein
MSSERLNTQTVEPNGRPVGGTKYSWCQAVPGGTGIAVLALFVSKAPDITCLQNAIHKLQNSHPILKSRLNSNTTTNSISFITSSTPFVQIKSFTILGPVPRFGLPKPAKILVAHLSLNIKKKKT